MPTESVDLPVRDQRRYGPAYSRRIAQERHLLTTIRASVTQATVRVDKH